MERASDDVARLVVPTLYLAGAKDEIITRKPTTRAAERLPRGARTAYYPQGWHLLLADLQRERVFEDVLAFIRDPSAALPSGTPPIPAPGKPSPATQAGRS